ncbi:uncharacterized protein LOC129771948 [Toxorhynchites rutilus septentrionalis]|uniref:uncharacterized protein LOC129771948 n=1 Tax=Toxorhynchites rutilus septentrionalis TaxID=329112 RepID=UPI00247A5958|nr:uncharacterized protein LOC129771948 [Toxorhynchites rutilus septentrionalis]
MANKSLELKLDEDFLFILNFSQGSIHLFANRPVERTLIESWFEKLCMEPYRGVEAKRLRNLYLVKLVTCIQSGVLVDHFCSKPVPGSLEPLPMAVAPSNMDEPPWLKDFEAGSAGVDVAGGAKNFSSYLCTKKLENNRGLCLYLAVSMADDDHKPEWLDMVTGRPRLLSEQDEEIEEAFQKVTTAPRDEDGGPDEWEEYNARLLRAIRNELAGSASPRDDTYLEQLLADFGAYIANKSMGRELETYSDDQKRSYMLGYLEKKLEHKPNDKRRYVH